jgi:hypothetical protein
MQDKSADRVRPRPRNSHVEKAWARYAYAFEERARLVDTAPPTLVSAYTEREQERMKVLNAKYRRCNELLLEYFTEFDADQMEAFGYGP